MIIFAALVVQTEGEECGPSCTCVLVDGTLTISGSGSISSYPWSDRIDVLKEVRVGNGITRIGDKAFKDATNLVSASIASTVTVIGDEVFSGCESLSFVDFPDSVAEIGVLVFNSCPKLLSGRLGAISWTLNKETGDMTFTGEGTLRDFTFSASSRPWSCSSEFIERVVISEGILEIGGYFFHGSSHLVSVSLPESLRVIGGYAFSECPRLTSGTFGKITWQFDDATETLSVSGKGALPNAYENGAPWSGSSSRIKAVDIGDDITVVGDFAFYGCDVLETVHLPASLTAVGINAFGNCPKLDNFVIPSKVRLIAACGVNCIATLSKDALVIEGNGPMMDFSTRVPPSWSSVNGRIKSATLKSGITTVGSSSLTFASSLESVVMPTTITSIGKDAFYACSSLESVDIPKKVTAIGDNAFALCSELASVTIPGSVTTIGRNAFSSCSALKTIVFDGTEPPHCSSGVFEMTHPSAVVVPSAYSSSMFCDMNVDYASEGSFDISFLVFLGVVLDCFGILAVIFGFILYFKKRPVLVNGSGHSLGNDASGQNPSKATLAESK